MWPALDIISTGIGNNCRADARVAKRLQGRQYRILYSDESFLKTPAPALHCLQNSFFRDVGINRMSHEPHRFDTITHAAETTAQHVFIVIAALPLLGGNTKDLRNRELSSQRRRRNTDQSMKEVEQYCLR